MPGAAPRRALVYILALLRVDTLLHRRRLQHRLQHQNDEQIRDENRFLKEDIESLKDRVSALVSEHEVVAAGGGWQQRTPTCILISGTARRRAVRCFALLVPLTCLPPCPLGTLQAALVESQQREQQLHQQLQDERSLAVSRSV